MLSAIARTPFERLLLGFRHESMRVFLTGATGLIRSHLAKYLVERGDEVVALVLPYNRVLESCGVASAVRKWQSKMPRGIHISVRVSWTLANKPLFVMCRSVRRPRDDHAQR